MTQRKSRRRWWGRRPFRPKRYAAATQIHLYENYVILKKVREGGSPQGKAGYWVFTAEALCNAHPDLFVRRHMGRALRRMKREGLIRGTGRWGKNPIYELDEREEERAA